MSFQLNKTLTDLLKYYIILKAIHIFFKMTTKYGPISNLISRKTSLLDTFSTSSPNKSNRSTWAAVTGASSGIGRAYALALASQGFNLILIARRRERLLALATHLKDTYNVETHIVVSDLSKLNSTNTKDLVDQITNSDIYSIRNIVSTYAHFMSDLGPTSFIYTHIYIYIYKLEVYLNVKYEITELFEK